MSTTTAPAKSPRRMAMEKLVDLAKKVRNGTYFVKRGPINWAAFPWEQKERAIAIMIDRAEFMRQNAMGNTAEITIEAFARMPLAEAGKEIERSIDDGVLDELVDDVASVLNALMQSTDPDGFPIDFRRSYQKADFVEAHDADLGVQGIIVSFTITY